MIVALTVLAWASDSCAAAGLAGRTNPVTQAYYTEEQCDKVAKLKELCPTNPLIPGVSGPPVRASVDDQGMASGGDPDATQRVLEAALRGLRARTLLADHVLRTEKTGHWFDLYTGVVKQCVPAYTALFERFPGPGDRPRVGFVCPQANQTDKADEATKWETALAEIKPCTAEPAPPP